MIRRRWRKKASYQGYQTSRCLFWAAQAECWLDAGPCCQQRISRISRLTATRRPRPLPRGPTNPNKIFPAHESPGIACPFILASFFVADPSRGPWSVWPLPGVTHRWQAGITHPELRLKSPRRRQQETRLSSLSYTRSSMSAPWAKAEVVLDRAEVRFCPHATSAAAMMILGFAGVGFMAYRRKSRGSAFRIA